jgi:hypothetical protein
MMKKKENKMTQAAPDFKPVPGETAEQKKARLTAKREYQQKKEDERVAAINAQRAAENAEREKVMKPLLFELLVKAAEYHVDANVCLKDPERSWGGGENPGVQFRFAGYDVHYLHVHSEQWEVDSVLAKFKEMDDAKAEALRLEGLRQSAREKLLGVLTEEERKAVGF